MFKRLRVFSVATTIALLMAYSPASSGDQLKPNDFCFAVMGFEGDGGPVFIIANEKEFKESGAYVGPPLDIVPSGFVVSPYSDVTFEYQGTIAAGIAELEAAGFKECPEIAP
ncbi:MAG TPA: hypothetical protein VF883_22835 [Thermoanaerobaculia bacterium]